MRAIIKKSRAVGVIFAPSSKSISHRVLIAAALADGVSVLSGVSESEDILATVDALRTLGAECEREGDTWTVHGIDRSKVPFERKMFCRESGSTLRFLIPLALTLEGKTEFFGKGRLMSRPLDLYEEICRERGIEFSLDGEGLTVGGGLTSGKFRIRGDVSSQFISGMLFALPLLGGDSEIELIPPIESKPYIDMTLAALRDFGIEYEVSENTIKIRGQQRYLPRNMRVEGDYSGSAFLDAFNLVGGDVRVENLSPESLQGDKIYIDYYKSIKGGGHPTFDVSDCPDLAPILMTLAAVKGGATFTGTGRLKLKESDRGETMSEELRKFGARIDLSENEITVHGSVLHVPTEPLSAHGDHRIAMSLAVISSLYGGEIDGAESVTKSYPDFWRDVKSLGIEVELYENN